MFAEIAKQIAESHKVALRNSFNHFNETKIDTIDGEMWPQWNVLVVRRIYIIHLALSGKRGSSSSLLHSSANWLKEQMLALVYNIINQLCSAVIHWVAATTCNVRSIGSTSEFVAAFVGTRISRFLFALICL